MSPLCGTEDNVTICLQRGARMEMDFRRATLRCAPEGSIDAQDPCGWTQNTKQAKMQTIARKDYVWMLYFGCTFFSGLDA